MILRFALLCFVFAASAAPLPPATQRAQDFEAAWRAIDEGYAYFDAGGREAWRRVRALWKPRAAKAKSRAEFVTVLERALAQLHDDHVALSERTRQSPRRVPADTDIWARWQDGAARVEAVRTFGDADVAGLRPGQQVMRIGDQPVEQAVRQKLGGNGAGPEERDWALRHALAGPRAGVVRVEVAADRGSRRVEIERADVARANAPPIIARRIGEARDIGYIRIRLGLAQPRLAEQFEGALNYMRDTRGLVVDLRDLPPEGPREATLGILALFAAAETKWQVREEAGGTRIADVVAPRNGSPYRAPMLVLVDRWTAGEAEALAAGLVAVANARLVGTPMAGLRGELRTVALPHSGIQLRFPAQRTLHVDGTPREKLRPHVAVDLAAPSGGPGDPILYQALKVLEK